MNAAKFYWKKFAYWVSKLRRMRQSDDAYRKSS